MITQTHLFDCETHDKRVLYSSRSDEWGTPPEIFDPLDAEFQFTVDVCATKDNAKCATFFTPEMDGLAQSWAGHTCWLNPPYTQRQAGKWLEKAIDASRRYGSTVVCLVPARTDTAWWHESAVFADEIRFIRGRIAFLGSDKTSDKTSDILSDENAPKISENVDNTNVSRAIFCDKTSDITDARTATKSACAPFPSAVLVYKPYGDGNTQYRVWNPMHKS